MFGSKHGIEKTNNTVADHHSKAEGIGTAVGDIRTDYAEKMDHSEDSIGKISDTKNISVAEKIPVALALAYGTDTYHFDTKTGKVVREGKNPSQIELGKYINHQDKLSKRDLKSTYEPNYIYEADGKIFETDDNGKVYSVDGETLSNITYTIDGKTYETDENGKVYEKKGGSYGELFIPGEGDKYEVHHMPANNATNLDIDDGPAIKMEKSDHRKTASCGNSREAREYRQKQRELIEQGRFRDALEMDISDIHDKFGSKYDDAIKQMEKYVDKLEMEAKI